MPWQLAIGISTVAGVIRILTTRRYAQHSTAPATFPPAISYSLGVVPIGLFAGFFLFPHHVDWNWWVVMLILLLAGAMAVSNWLAFMVAGRMSVASSQTIGKLSDVTIVALGWAILGEGLVLHQLTGGIILLAAALLAIWAPVKASDGQHRRLSATTVILTAISALTLAVGLVTEKALLGHMQIGGIFLISWTSQALAMVLLALKDANRSNFKKLTKYEVRWSTTMGLMNGVNGAFYVYSIFHSDNISLIAAIGTVAMPLLVIGAYLFLKEREHTLLMWVSLAISFIGLLILSLG